MPTTPAVNAHDVGKSHLVVAVMWTQFAISFVFTLARYGINYRVTGASIGLDGHCLWINLIFFLGYVGFCTHAAKIGFGRHQWDLQTQQFVDANFYENIGQTSAAISLFFCKSCVAFFLLRIIIDKTQRMVIWIAVSIQAIMTILCCVLLYTQITPVEGVWNPFLKGVKVNFNFVPFAITYASISAAYDFFLGIAPFIFLRKLNMKAQERYTICASLSIGISAGIFAIIRAVRVSSLGAKADYSYETVEVILWTSSEITASCISICIPPFRSLYKHYRRGQGSTDRSNSNKYDYRLDPLDDTKRSNNNTKKIMGSMASTHQGNTSDESILGPEFRFGTTGIKQTREVMVDYSQASDKEMNRVSNAQYGNPAIAPGMV